MSSHLKTSNDLKALSVNLKILQQEEADLSKIYNELEVKKRKLRQQITSLEKEIEKLKNSRKELVVSEHAILRYLERVVGIDLTDITNKIVNNSELCKNYSLFGMNGTYPFSGSIHAVIENGVIKTFINKKV